MHSAYVLRRMSYEHDRKIQLRFNLLIFLMQLCLTLNVVAIYMICVSNAKPNTFLYNFLHRH